jgi:hypothetical protein
MMIKFPSMGYASTCRRNMRANSLTYPRQKNSGVYMSHTLVAGSNLYTALFVNV